MDSQEVLAELIGILAPLAKGRAVSPDTELIGDLALESLQIMNLVLAIEDRFDISVPVNALADVRTVGDLAVQIEKQLGHD